MPGSQIHLLRLYVVAPRSDIRASGHSGYTSLVAPCLNAKYFFGVVKALAKFIFCLSEVLAAYGVLQVRIQRCSSLGYTPTSGISLCGNCLRLDSRSAAGSRPTAWPASGFEGRSDVLHCKTARPGSKSRDMEIAETKANPAMPGSSALLRSTRRLCRFAGVAAQSR